MTIYLTVGFITLKYVAPGRTGTPELICLGDQLLWRNGLGEHPLQGPIYFTAYLFEPIELVDNGV